ncbi:MAG: MBL fold metallo-hydrolase [Oscillospiraceae bacterium]|nr:MBL fold metallo-hydrolase [Oscillospiraceae bacterium]
MAKNRITAIDENTWCIEESNGMVYGFLLAGRDRAVLLDTGFGTCDYKKMAASVTALPVDVINTHGHLDHVSQNYAFDRAYLHPADETVFREHTDAAMRLGYIRMLLREAKLPAFLVDSGLVKLLTKKVCEIPAKDNRLPLRDGEEFDLGGRTLRIIYTPGHTPGSVCVLDAEKRRLFSGDTVCDEGVLLNFDHSCSVKTFRESIEKLKSMSDQWDEIWPAHHLKPIDNSFLDLYLTCTDGILAGAEKEKDVPGLLVREKGRIKLCYTADKL